MVDCRICNADIKDNDPDQLCYDCRHLRDMFEAHELEMAYCGECIYATKNPWEDKLDCHRKAPSAADTVFNNGMWPKMKPNYWCGEGIKR